jgi:ferredoxin
MITEKKSVYDHYKFHHIDTSKCNNCKEFSCEDVCFRGIYEVVDKENTPKCTVIKDREDFCVKCHLCTTACKFRAIKID